MTNFKKIHLGESNHILVAQNGQIFHYKDGVTKKVTFTIDKRKSKTRTYLYQRFSIKGKLFYVHKIMATAWIENPNDFEFVRHKDGNSLNNSISNLEWCYNSHDVRRVFVQIETDAFYQSIDRKKLSGQNVWIYDYFMKDNEAPIRELFQGEKLRAICKWYSYQKEGDKFESLYDDLYENILSKIKRGVLKPRFGVKSDNSLFNYTVRTFDWLCYHNKKQFTEFKDYFKENNYEYYN